MSNSKHIYNRFFSALETLTTYEFIKTVKKTDANSINQEHYNCIQVVIGQNVRSEFTKELDRRDLTIYADVHVQFVENHSDPEIKIDDVALEICDLIEETILSSENLGLDNIFYISCLGHSEPDYNAEGIDLASSKRLEFNIEYYELRKN